MTCIVGLVDGEQVYLGLIALGAAERKAQALREFRGGVTPDDPPPSP